MSEVASSLLGALQRPWRWFALVWLSLGVLLALELYADRLHIEQRERQLLAQQAAALDNNLGQQLAAIDHALQSLLLDLPRWRSQPDSNLRVTEYLNAYADAMPMLRTFNLMDEQGRVLASNNPAMVGQEFASRAYFQQLRALHTDNPLLIADPFQGVLGGWILLLARAQLDRDGNFVGAITATLEPRYFNTYLESQRSKPHMFVALVHGRGLRFLSVGDVDEPVGVDLSAPETLFAQHRASGQASTLLRGPLRSGAADYLVAMRTVQIEHLRAPSELPEPLVVVVGHKWKDIFAQWYAKLWVLGSIYLLAGAAAAWGLLYLRASFGRLRQQELRQQARWTAVLQATEQGVWDWDGRSRQMYYSPQWKAMIGYADADIGSAESEWLERIHPQEKERVLQAWQAHIDGATPHYQCVLRMRCKDGSYVWTRDRGRVVERDAQGRALRIMGVQVLLDEQQTSQQLLQRLAENVPGVIYQFQMEADGRGHFPYASAGVQDIYGYSPQQLRDSAAPAMQRILEEDRQAVYDSVLTSMRTLQTWVSDYRVDLPERGVRWLSGHAKPQRLDSGAVLWYGYIQDVTEAKQQALKLQETERALRHLMRDMPVALCMIDEQHRMYFRNRRFLEFFGYTEEQVPGLREWALKAYPDADYREQAVRQWQRAKDKAQRQGGDIAQSEYRITAADGSHHVMEVGGLIFGQHLLVTFQDRTAQQAQNELLQRLAYVDGLTGIANRRQFDQSLEAEWRRCRRSGKPLSLVLLDIDFFKPYNDLYGHQQGDECLKSVAKALLGGVARSHDLVARYGGEEFVCLLPECDAKGALYKAQNLVRMVQALGLAHAASPLTSVVTISAGVASQVPDGHSTPQDLLAQADANLYRAKQQGRNRVEGNQLQVQ